MINILTNRILIILVFILELSSSYRYLNFWNKKTLFVGSWKLRTSNDDNFNYYVYLKLNIDNTFKFTGLEGELIPLRNELAQVTAQFEGKKLQMDIYKTMIEVWRTLCSNQRSAGM